MHIQLDALVQPAQLDTPRRFLLSSQVEIALYHTTHPQVPSPSSSGYLPRIRSMRKQIAAAIPCKAIQWLRQVHGNQVVAASTAQHIPNADASFISHTGVACAVLTADCLPIVIYSKTQPWAACVHAGWRGLAQNIISATCQHYPGPIKDLAAWIGPHICSNCYQVDSKFQARFVELDQGNSKFFTENDGYITADLSGIAHNQLYALGFTTNRVSHANICTHHNQSLPSYRRDNYLTGRIVTLVWIND
ncbi:MAG: peptidoglycan editing factor PgeF [Pseudomonadota bacterium]|nr:peptidoglycan editing factor PgeF [Pseudomonadota bacterium]